MSADPDLILSKARGIASVTFNRPAVKNALTFRMCEDLIGFLQELREDRSVRVLLLRGAGADFSSGADLKDVSAMVLPDPAARGAGAEAQVRALSMPLFGALYALPQPVVCSVRGYAVGAGMQMALMADLVLASETAKFVLPQVRLGHNVDHGESWTLPRKVGMGRAMQIMALGETLGGRDAERLGIANWVVGDDELEPRTDELVERLASGASVAIREMKELLRGSAQRTFEAQFDAEAQALRRCAASEDFAEAIGAFMEKRKPRFQGR